MSCGTCSEKTKAGVAAALGAPVATGAAGAVNEQRGGGKKRLAARHGQQFTDPKILRLANSGNLAVIHWAAINGQQITDPEILRLADNHGWTIAHSAAAGGQQITDPEILKLADKRGRTVENVVSDCRRAALAATKGRIETAERQIERNEQITVRLSSRRSRPRDSAHG